MSRMFCTLEEAARTLQTSEEQIRALVERGILREFRQGPHRLLRQADVGALQAVGQSRSPAARASTSDPSPAGGASAPSQARRRARHRPSRAATAVAEPPRSQCSKESRADAANQGKTPQRRPPTEDRRPRIDDSDILRPPAALLRAQWPGTPSAPRRPGPAAAPSQSLRQWFWMGLIQDRPTTIALLASLILLGLSALAAGICLAYEL
jgi:excisionase family DNA binding protein